MTFRRPWPLLLAFLAVPPVRAEDALFESHRTSVVSASPLEIRAWGPDQSAVTDAIDLAFAEIDRIEGIFDLNAPDGALCRFNAAPVGTPMAVAPEIMAAAERSQSYREATEGAFDPALEPLTRLWQDGDAWTSLAWKKAFGESGIEHFDVDVTQRTITRLRSGAHLDFEPLLKGLAMDAAAARLLKAGAESARLNWGGQILAVGPQRAEPYQVTDPSTGAPLARFPFDRGAVMTRSQRQTPMANGQRRWGPVIDPRKLRVVECERVVTVLASSAEEADALSSALLVLGPEDGAYLISAHFPRAAALFVDKIGGGWRLTPSSKFPKASLEILNEDAQITLP